MTWKQVHAMFKAAPERFSHTKHYMQLSLSCPFGYGLNLSLGGLKACSWLFLAKSKGENIFFWKKVKKDVRFGKQRLKIASLIG